MSDIVADDKSGEFDLDDTTSAGSMPSRRVCLNDNHEASYCQLVWKISRFIKNSNWNFSYRRNRQIEAVKNNLSNCNNIKKAGTVVAHERTIVKISRLPET